MRKLEDLRKEIDTLDQKLMKLLDERFNLTNEIGQIKRKDNINVLNKDREEEILSKTYDYNNNLLINKTYEQILKISKESQKYTSYLLTKDASYTYSPIIHSMLGNSYYYPLENVNLEQFLNTSNLNYKGVNITNPYKKDAYNYCINNNIILDEYANKTKIVNFILNDGELKAYNTDYLGFKALLEFYNIDINNKNILLLGNGSTSTTVRSVLEELNPTSITTMVRTIRNDNEISFNNASKIKNIDIVINTTSYNVYPSLELSPLIDLSNLGVKTIIDVNYNPNRSILSIKNPHIPYINGLYMLIEQARLAEELILNKEINKSINKEILNKLNKDDINICLIGMPFSGKTTIGQKLSAKLGKTFFDSDIILKEENLSLSKLLSLGFSLEDYRSYESSIIETLANVSNSVISTGGGVIENIDNINYLKQKGLIIFLDTPLDILKKRIKNDRPLVKNIDDLTDLFNKRYDKYLNVADISVNTFDSSKELSVDEIVDILEVKINEYLNH